MSALRRAVVRGAAVAALAAVAACGSHGGSTTAPSRASGKVGYVRMDELVQKHPLYGQLAQYDRSIQAFDLAAVAPRAVARGPELAAREKDLERQLNAAAARTQKLLDAKQREYQAQEAQAIDAALRSAGQSAPSAGEIAGRIDATAQRQAGTAASQAQRDFEAYRKLLEKQANAQISAAQRTLAARADRTYRSKADELQSKEAALSLKVASDDAPQRLALRTKLSSLALDDAQREAAQKDLSALDKKEADAVAAQRRADQRTLDALQAQLRAQVSKDLAAQAGRIRSRTVALLDQRRNALQKQVASAGGPVLQTKIVNGKPQQEVNPNLPPDLRRRIEQLHNDYLSRFQNDAKTTIADFNKTRDDLSRRYAQLQGVDATASAGARAQVESLKKKREDLYNQIVAQIDREARVVAEQRGVSVVLTNVVAPAGGVDLTPDVMKDIESLHE